MWTLSVSGDFVGVWGSGVRCTSTPEEEAMIGHLAKRARAEQRDRARDTFDDFCRQQRLRVQWRLTHVPVEKRDSSDPSMQLRRTGDIVRRGVSGGGGMPYHRRRWSVDY